MSLHILLILFIAWIVGVLAVILHTILRQLRSQIDVRAVINDCPSYDIAFVKRINGEEAQAFLPTGESTRPVGRIKISKQGDKAIVMLLITSLTDDSETPVYKQFGYIAEDGYIYEQENPSSQARRIGFVAPPSNPKQPCTKGDRSWRTLWLREYLNVYKFKNPNQPVPDPSAVQPAEPETTEQEPDLDPVIEDTPIVEPENVPVTDETPVQEESLSEETSSEEPTFIVEEPLKEGSDPEESESEKDNNDEKEDSSTEPSRDSEEEEKLSINSYYGPRHHAVIYNAGKEEKEAKKDKSGKKQDAKEAKAQAKEQKKQAKLNKRAPAPNAILAATCDMQGRGANVRGITDISRAGAYALLAQKFQTHEYEEFYRKPVAGWKDTALVASLIYAIIFFIYYLVNTSLLQRPLLGKLYLGAPVLFGFYFIIWAFLRSFKVERADSGNTFQPYLDLVNKSVGQQNIDLTIIIMGCIALGTSAILFELDFIPLILAILTGFGVNRFAPEVGKSWRVRKSYYEEDEDSLKEEGSTIVEHTIPTGEISCTYDWDLDDEKSLHGNVSINFDIDKINEERQNNPFYSQDLLKSTDMVKKMYETLKNRPDYMERTNYLARQISKIADKADLSEYKRVQFVLDFIQEPNIRFVRDKDSSLIQYAIRYMRFPDETLMDKEGDYDCKTFLAAMLYNALGYDVLFLYSTKHDHYAVGVEEKGNWTDKWENPDNKYLIEHNMKKYVICETTVDKFKAGDLLAGITENDFDTIISLPKLGAKGNVDDIERRTYDWDLDSEDGFTKLHGMCVVDFNPYYIGELRSKNPFLNYPDSGKTYEQNILSMAKECKTNSTYLDNLRTIASVVKEKTESLSELNKLQFAIDFVQEPNIRYCIDEHSVGINYAKEYMRFPDETLFDKEGDCDCKSFLGAMLYNVLGYNVLFLLSKKYEHAAIAIECKEEWFEMIRDLKYDDVVLEHNGRKYIFCETTGDGNRIGHIKEGENISGFESRTELLA